MDQADPLDVDLIAHPHTIGQETEVRLVYAQHVLHRLGRDPDLLADHPLAVRLAQGERRQRNGVGVVYGEHRIALDQRRQCSPLAQRIIEFARVAFVPVRGVGSLGHKYFPS